MKANSIIRPAQLLKCLVLPIFTGIFSCKVVVNCVLSLRNILIFGLLLWAQGSSAQSKLNITSTTAPLTLCADAASFEIDVRNISTGTVAGITVTVRLPSGMAYELKSLQGSGITEKNVSNLQEPEFSLTNLAITKNNTFSINLRASCSMITFLNKGGIPKANITALYTGGAANHVSLPFTVKQPSLSVFSVSNQFVIAAKEDTIFREIQLKNSGDGHLPLALFFQTNQNGLKMLGVSGGVLSSNGDTVFSKFDSSYFKTIGNKDIYWSKNEILHIYDTLLVAKCANFQSKYVLDLNCFGSVCTQTTASANVTLKNVAPLLKIIPFSKIKTCYDANTTHEHGLTIINTGSDTSKYTTISAFQSYNGGLYTSILSAIDTSNITLQYGARGAITFYKTNSVHANSSSGVMSCLGTGSIAGFDALISDIPPGDTVFLKWTSNSCCATTCGTAYRSFRWRYSATYRDRCDDILLYPEAWGSGGIYTGISMAEFMPTDVRAGDTSKFIITVASGYLYNATARAKTEIRFVLPKGVNHSLNKKDFRFERFDGTKWEPNSISKSGDTVRAFFIGVPKITLVRSELHIKVFGDCSNSGSNQTSSYSIELDFINDTACTVPCTKRLYCYTGTVRTHCNQNCGGGMKFSAFDAERISFGLPDNDNNSLPDGTGKLDKDKIKLERVMYGDTLLTKFRGTVKRRGTTTTWSRITATSVINYGKFLSVADARINIYRAGNLLYSCPKLASTFTTSGNSRTFTFDLSTSALIRASCPLYSGFKFFANDSVELEVRYLVSVNPGSFLRETSITNEFYLHTVASPNSSQKYQCDTFSGKFILVGSYFTNYGRNNISSNGCNEISFSQNYYLSVGVCCSNYGGGNAFPYEYRSWAKPVGIFAIRPKGYDYIHAKWTDWRTAGTGKTATQRKDTITPLNPQSDTIKFDIGQFFKDKSGTFELSDDGFHGNVTIKMKPNCEAESTGVMRYGFVFERKNYFGSGLDTVYTASQNDFITYSKPKVKITALSTDVSSNSDTVEWQIRLENTSNVSVATNTWFGASNNGNTTLVEVYDLDAKSRLPMDYDYFKLGDIQANQTRNILVRGTYKNCGKDSFFLLLGHNCRSYPDSVVATQCPPTKLHLKYEPLNTRLESSIEPIDSTIDLCKDILQEVTVANKGNSKAFNLYFDLFLRSGMSLKDTAWLFLPNSTDSVAIVAPTDLGQNTYRWEISKQSKFLDSNGLESVTSTKVNFFKLKYYLITDCDFTSSIYYLARPGGELKCGDEVNSGYAFSKPINVKGVKKPYFSDTKLTMGALDICKYDGKGTVRFINLGPDTTGDRDFIQLTLPKGIYLDTTYLTGTSNVPAAKPSFIGQVGEWKIPSGIQPGDSMLFEFDTYEAGFELDCGNTQIIINSVVTQPAFCVSENKYCDIKVSTSGDLILDSIKKALFVLSHVNSQAVPVGTQEQISLQYQVINTGTPKDSGVLLIVKIIDDVNQNGIRDANENAIYLDSIVALVDLQKTIRQISFLGSPVSSCRLLLIIDSTNCVCSPSSLAIPPISVKNAGMDTTLCSRLDVTIGNLPKQGFTYEWSPKGNIRDVDSSQTIFNGVNSAGTDATYQLILETDKGACKTNDTVLITLHPALFLDLKPEEHLCEGQRVIVGEIVTGGTGFNTYLWTPSDSLVSTNKVKTWANPTKTTTYTLSVVDDLQCKISDTTRIVVHPSPIADFTFNDTCEGELYYFKNQSKKKDSGIDSVHWQIGTEESFFWDPIVLMDSSYNVHAQLFVQDSFGCWDSIGKTLDVYPRPIADFTFNDTCEGLSVDFTNTSTIKSGGFGSSWQSGSGNGSALNFSLRYNSNGNHDVKLLVESDRGCQDSTTKSIEIFEKPDLSLRIDSVCEGNITTISAINSFSTGDTISNFIWDLGDGQNATTKTVEHRYSLDSLYSVRLIVESNHGCRDTADGTALVYQKPQAQFKALSACLGDSNILVNQTPENKFVKKNLYWNDGSGYTLGSDSQQYLFNTIGLQTVSMIVESEDFCRDTLTKNALVLHRETPNLTQNGNCENEIIELQYNPQYPDSVLSNTWIYQNSNIGSAYNLLYDFAPAGIHKVQLEIDHKNGCFASKEFDVTIDPKPNSLFAYVLPCTNNFVQFTSNSTTPLGTIVNHNWDLGDGTTRNLINLNHTYPAIGAYQTELIVENSFGCFDTSSQTVDIQYIVVPDFVVRDICANDLQTIRDSSSGFGIPIQKYEFDMGDGSVFNSSSFDYAYAVGGTYTIQLTIETAPGCTYTTSKTIQVYNAPSPGFKLDQSVLDLVNNKVVLTDTSQGGTKYEYDVSDGTFYSVPSFEHEFNDTGSFTIKQKVIDDFGCYATFEQSIQVYLITNVFVPNAFHPDGDGLNDIFEPKGLGIKSYEVQVFDRWGGKVYESMDSKPWDGSDYPTGVYYYQFRVTDYQLRFLTFSGTVHLLR
jgi:gliding motility-associated-like protein